MASNNMTPSTDDESKKMSIPRKQLEDYMDKHEHEDHYELPTTYLLRQYQLYADADLDIQNDEDFFQHLFYDDITYKGKIVRVSLDSTFVLEPVDPNKGIIIGDFQDTNFEWPKNKGK